MLEITLKLSLTRLILFWIVLLHLVTRNKYAIAVLLKDNFTNPLIKNDELQDITSPSQQQQRLSRTLRNLSFFGISKRLKGNRNTNNGQLEIAKSIVFYYYKNGNLILEYSPGDGYLFNMHAQVLKECGGSVKTAFVFHGWTESCSTSWVEKLMERLAYHRGGCIICVDYGKLSKKPYIELLQMYNDISEILYKEISDLIGYGLNPKNGYMFGFSYGGQLASHIGRNLSGDKKFKKVDICDLSGPGFDFLTNYNHSAAAEVVECYHTSIDKGSHFDACHKNIRFGYCGYTQPAILTQPFYNSHGFCVIFYINAFDYNFYATNRPPQSQWCFGKTANYHIPSGYTVGYHEEDQNGSDTILGDIFVPTSFNFPYNLSKKELMLYESRISNNAKRNK